MNPLVSIIMPVYNAEKFLAATMESMLAQTLTEFEFVIVDDCSTDSSTAIIKSYNDKRIRYFKNEKNSGITYTLNRAIDLSETEYLARMDADDLCHPQRLEKQYHYLHQHADCALIATSANVVDEKGALIYKEETPPEFYYFKLTFTSPFYHSSVMYRRSAVLEAGKYTEMYAEDFELFWRLCRRHRFHVIHEPLLDYRVSDQSLFHSVKRSEYSAAASAQCLRNIQFYKGADYTVPDAWLKCYQFEFDVLRKMSVTAVMQCVAALADIAETIDQKPNPNLCDADMRGALKDKQAPILNDAISIMPLAKAVHLLFLLKRYKSISSLIRRRASNFYKNKR